MIIWVIAMPTIYSVMAIKSVTRAYALLEPTCTHYPSMAPMPNNVLCRGGYTRAVTAALYTENFQLANLCQYYVVFLFSRLCWHIIKCDLKDKPEIYKVFKFVAFQGVHAWIAVGSIYVVLQFAFAYVCAHEIIFNFNSRSSRDSAYKTINEV